MTVLRSVDKLDKFGPEGVKLLLGEGRKDESGDFTAGAGLSEEQIALVLGFVEAERERRRRHLRAADGAGRWFGGGRRGRARAGA